MATVLMTADVQIQRGRDPWVFRAVFEDRPRSLIVAAGNDIWFAFNSTTCAWHKIWKGSIDFKGKVYDFSQDSSKAVGDVLAKSYDEVFILPNEADLPIGWTSQGVTFRDGGWDFSGNGAYLQSPEFDLSRYTTLYVAFDERSRAGRLRVEVVNDGKVTEYFGSSTDVGSETNWMWNFKYLLDRGENARIRFVQEKDSDNKMMRSARLFGDHPGWAVMTPSGLKEATPQYRGYETDGRRAVRIDFDLVTEDGTVSLQVRPEVSQVGSAQSWRANYSVTSAPTGFQPVMIGWTDYLDKDAMQGDATTWRGMSVMVIRSKTFSVSGRTN